MDQWVDFTMALCGMPIAPIHEDEDRGPERRTWTPLGRMPALETRLGADEAYAYMGVSTYQRDFVMMGRMYVLIVRRASFAWKIVLSFMTAVLEEVMPQSMLDSNDHVRAGAVLGTLALDGRGLENKSGGVGADGSTRGLNHEVPILQSNAASGGFFKNMFKSKHKT